MLFVAEIGSNHKGQKALAYEMIRLAKQAGADIAKFQLDRKPGEDDLIRNAPTDWVEFLAESCRYFDIEFMASIWSIKGLDLARHVKMKRYKLAHQLDDPTVIQAVLNDGKEVFWSNPPVDAKGIFRKIFCFEEYPAFFRRTPNETDFGTGAGYSYGYSDHTCGIEACLFACACGAKYIEKHMTLDKTEESIKDNHFSATPDEFADLVKYGRALARLA